MIHGPFKSGFDASRIVDLCAEGKHAEALAEFDRVCKNNKLKVYEAFMFKRMINDQAVNRNITLK
jgi:hypothetical protein